MMEQYLEIKRKYEDHILFYRLGDFYEMFYDDAKTVSRELELTLTGRDCGEAERAPMCGVPYHSCEPYINKLVSRGYKVAICEQIGEPGSTKGPMERRIVRVITPGTVTSGDLLREKENNYLATIYYDSAANRAAVAFCDITQSSISATSFPLDDEARIINELAVFSPSEVLSNTDEKSLPRTFSYISDRLSSLTAKNDSGRFEKEACRQRCDDQFGVLGAESFSRDDEITCAAGALLSYVAETQLSDISYIKELNIYAASGYLEIDMSTRRSLEITETMRSKEKRGSLLSVLDRTKSALGARLLRAWLEHPLCNTQAIRARQDAVGELAEDFMLRAECQRLLGSVLDLERLTTKVGFGTANGRDLRAIMTTLDIIPELRSLLSGASSSELRSVYDELDELSDVRELIRASIAEEPPFTIRA